MKKRYLVGLATGLIIIGTSNMSAGSTISTTGSWNGATYVQPFGEPNTSTYGQTFTVGTDTAIDNFSFYLNDNVPVKFNAYLYKWDGNKATGGALYASNLLSTTNNSGSGGFEKISVNTGGVNLITGNQYVAFFSAANQFDGASDSSSFGFVSQNVYSGGQFVFLNNGSWLNSILYNNWTKDFVAAGSDLAFSMNFSQNSAPQNLVIHTILYPTQNETSTVDEGSWLKIYMTATDHNPDNLTFSINGSSYGTVSGATDSMRTTYNNYMQLFDNNGINKNKNLEGTVADGNGGIAAINKMINIVNVAPQNVLLALPTAINEGDSVTAQMSATDPGDDYLHFTINGQDAGTGGNVPGTTRTSNTVSLGQYFDDDGAKKTATILGSVMDEAATTTKSGSLTINNVAPDATMHLSKTTISEGDFISAYMTATDPGNDYLDFTIAGQNAGIGVGGNVAGSTRTSDTVNLGQFFQTGSTPTQVTVEGSVIDDGTVPDFASAIFSVLNVAPIIDDVTYLLTDRNHLAFGASAHDPGMDALSFSWDMDGDGAYDDFFGLGGTWEYLTAGLFSVGLQVADGDGGLGYRSFDITIDPAPVPEPATMLLMGTGLAGLVGSRCKRRNKA